MTVCFDRNFSTFLSTNPLLLCVYLQGHITTELAAFGKIMPGNKRQFVRLFLPVFICLHTFQEENLSYDFFLSLCHFCL
jgi:hypothetical protein